VRVRAVAANQPLPSPYLWESQGSWYDPKVPGNDARFVIQDTSDPRSMDELYLERSFGLPEAQYQVGRYVVYVWDRNLLDDVGH
jgi:hypothetical protein